MSNLKTTMEVTIKVLNANGTENIQLFRGEEFIGLDNLTEHEREIIIGLSEELKLSTEEESFRLQYLNGEVEMSDLDRFIDKWHNDSSITESLDQFLGFNFKEYEAFMKYGESELIKLLQPFRESKGE